MRMRFRIPILITIFLITAVEVGFVLVRPDCRCRTREAYEALVGKHKSDDQERFTSIAAGAGVSEAGMRFSDNVYLSSACILVEEHLQSVNSLERANNLAKAKLDSAFRILEQNPMLDKNGSPTGGRAVMLSGSRGQQAVIIKWSREGFMTLESSSLDTAAAFEREFTDQRPWWVGRHLAGG